MTRASGGRRRALASVRWLLLALPSALAGCDDSDPSPSLVDMWNLVAIADDPLPVRITTLESDTFDLVVGTLELEAGNAFTLIERFEHRDGDALHDTIPLITTGEWGRAGKDVWLGAVIDDSVVVDTLTYENDRLVNHDPPLMLWTFERSDD
jgi:hypothetical protein